LASLPRAAQERILRSSWPRQYRPAEVVYHEGDIGHSLHLVMSGHFAARLTTPHGQDVLFGVFQPGEFFGEGALLDWDVTRRVTVFALDAGDTYALPKDEFRRLIREHPDVAEEVLVVLTRRITHCIHKVVESLHTPAKIRVVRRLLELADAYRSDGPPLQIPLAQAVVAGLAGTSRGTVNEVLRQEEARGTIALGRRCITIVDEPRLIQRARFDRLGLLVRRVPVEIDSA
jgi:CRP/FNR family cyclic AMP-dependent transcriptional regulator